MTPRFIESRGQVYRLKIHCWSNKVIFTWTVVGLEICNRCDCPAPVRVERSSGTDMRATCCGLQLGVGLEAQAPR